MNSTVTRYIILIKQHYLHSLVLTTLNYVKNEIHYYYFKIFIKIRPMLIIYIIFHLELRDV